MQNGDGSAPEKRGDMDDFMDAIGLNENHRPLYLAALDYYKKAYGSSLTFIPSEIDNANELSLRVSLFLWFF